MDNILNAAQLTGLNLLNSNISIVGKTIHRLASGLRVRSSADDPSSSVLTSMNQSQVIGASSAIYNSQQGIKLLDTAFFSTLEIETLIKSAYDLAVRYLYDSSLTQTQLDDIETQIYEILDEATAIADNTTFAGRQILNGAAALSVMLDSQADWLNGYSESPVGSIDLDSNPGSVILQTITWPGTGPLHSVAAGLENYLAVEIDSIVDNGDGTHSATMTVEANGVNALNFTGHVNFSEGTTVTGVGGAGAWQVGDDVSFVFVTGGAAKNTFTIDFTAPDDAYWNVDLVKKNNAEIALYSGAAQVITPKNPDWAYSEYFTDINATGEYYSGAIDMLEAGGTGTFEWYADQPAGTSFNIILQESADGVGGWTDLACVPSGGSFDYTQRYLRVVATLQSEGIMYGTPSLNYVQINKQDPLVIYLGPDNNIDQQLVVDNVDARPAALGITTPILFNGEPIYRFDTAEEMAAGFIDLVNMDVMSDSGMYQLEAPIVTVSPPAGGSGLNWITVDYTAVELEDGTFDIVLNMKAYGRNMPPATDFGLSYIGNIYFEDAEGNQVLIDEVVSVGMGGTGWLATSYTVNGAPGEYTDVDFEIRTDGFGKGLSFKFNADPDVKWVIDVEVQGLSPFVPGYYTGNYHEIDVYNGSVLIANDQGQGVGDLHLEQRLAEYSPAGSFETVPLLIGDNYSASLSGVTNDPGDLIQYRVQESADGVSGWNTILDYGGGLNFTTNPGMEYIRVIAQVNSDPEVLDPGDIATPYTYTESVSDLVDRLAIDPGKGTIEMFQDALANLDDIRLQYATAYKILLEEIGFNNMRMFIDARMTGQITDADVAAEITNIAKHQMLTEENVDTLVATTDLILSKTDELLEEFFKSMDQAKESKENIFGGAEDPDSPFDTKDSGPFAKAEQPGPFAINNKDNGPFKAYEKASPFVNSDSESGLPSPFVI
ncbi:MAG TPA: flagellin [bacterium]|nr:flagellin [bacterium]